MYVVLTKEVPGLGLKNSLIKVRDGYYNNYLAPRSLARIASSKLLEQLKGVFAAKKLAAEQVAKASSEQAKTLVNAVLKFSVKASEKGTLFKALGERDISTAMKKQLGIEIGKDQVQMEHFKKVGDHLVTIDLGLEQVPLKVHIEAKAHEKEHE